MLQVLVVVVVLLLCLVFVFSGLGFVIQSSGFGYHASVLYVCFLSPAVPVSCVLVSVFVLPVLF